MISIDYKIIFSIVESFYAKANHDILIGYHFRVIENFDTHLPRIAAFWQLQLTGKIDKKEELPFDLLSVHKALKINEGEVYRWVVLFKKTLDEFEQENKITASQLEFWMEKVELFKKRIILIR